jgi:soluble cytochrome b562
MWTSATHLAELVASYRRAPQRPEQIRKGRTLPEADFEFRGGFAQLIGRVDRAHPHSGEPTFSR